jgi:hypothetical protein
MPFILQIHPNIKTFTYNKRLSILLILESIQINRHDSKETDANPKENKIKLKTRGQSVYLTHTPSKPSFKTNRPTTTISSRVPAPDTCPSTVPNPKLPPESSHRLTAPHPLHDVVSSPAIKSTCARQSPYPLSLSLSLFLSVSLQAQSHPHLSLYTY